MIVSLRPGHGFPSAGSVPQRRRVVIIGATEAGVSAAFHLGEQALLLEQKDLDAPDLTHTEIRLGTRVTAIDIRERRIEVSTGERFVYDKLVSTLHTIALHSLVADQLPRRIQSVEAFRYWLNGRDVELLDAETQEFLGDVDGHAAGKRVAEALHRVLAAKYTNTPLFQPRFVAAT